MAKFASHRFSLMVISNGHRGASVEPTPPVTRMLPRLRGIMVGTPVGLAVTGSLVMGLEVMGLAVTGLTVTGASVTGASVTGVAVTGLTDGLAVVWLGALVGPLVTDEVGADEGTPLEGVIVDGVVVGLKD